MAILTVEGSEPVPVTASYSPTYGGSPTGTVQTTSLPPTDTSSRLNPFLGAPAIDYASKPAAPAVTTKPPCSTCAAAAGGTVVTFPGQPAIERAAFNVTPGGGPSTLPSWSQVWSWLQQKVGGIPLWLIILVVLLLLRR